MKKSLICFILTAAILLLNFQKPVSAQQTAGTNIINTQDFLDLQKLLNQIELNCNVTCPKVDIHKANDLAEALMKTLYTVQVFNQKNEPAWLQFMENRAFQRHDSAQKRNNGISNPRLEQQWQACYKAVHLAAYTQKLVKKAQDKFYNSVNKYVSRKSYPFDPIPSFLYPEQGISYLNTQLKKNLAALKLCVSNFPITSHTEKPEIKLPKKLFLPGEEITITFKTLPCFAEDAWIGIVPSHIEHSEAKSDQHKISSKHIGNRTNGEMNFTMPKNPGRYEFRMFDTEEDGKEVFWTWFEVISHYVKTTKTTFTSTERIGIEYANFETNKPNWIIIAKAGDPAGVGTSLTITAKSKGTTSHKPLPEGEYEIRAFINGDRTKIADQRKFTVKKDNSQSNVLDPSLARSLSQKGKGLLKVSTPVSNCPGIDTTLYFKIFKNSSYVSSSTGPRADNPNSWEVKKPPYRFELEPGIFEIEILSSVFIQFRKTFEIKKGQQTIFSLADHTGKLEVRFFDKTGNPSKVYNYKIIIEANNKILFENYWWDPCSYDSGLLPTGDYTVTLLYTDKNGSAQKQVRNIKISPCKTVTLDFQDDGGSIKPNENGKGSNNIAGSWRTNYNNMVLEINGNKVTGTYEHRNGRLTGALNGNILRGIWKEDGESNTGEFEFTFTFTNNASTFQGKWKYAKNSDWSTISWNGTKIND